MSTDVTELIGVYDADGGARGEARYVIGKLLGTAHCSLCDITHSPIRRKPQWDQLVTEIGVPFVLLHRNEMPADVTARVAESATPIVLARTSDGTLVTALAATQLNQLDGTITSFAAALADALLALGTTS